MAIYEWKQLVSGCYVKDEDITDKVNNLALEGWEVFNIEVRYRGLFVETIGGLDFFCEGDRIAVQSSTTWFLRRPIEPAKHPRKELEEHEEARRIWTESD